ncbi:MAG: hypothetical protein ACJAU0_001966 [Flavobacteriales bacterium]
MKSLLTTTTFSSRQKLKDFLDEKADHYNQPAFLKEDPVQIPHSLKRKEDKEIAGFLAATIAWGQRPTIIRNAYSILERMDGAPHDFVCNAQAEDLKRLEGFVHRTFNDSDLLYFIEALRNIYSSHGGLEQVFTAAFNSDADASDAIACFRSVFFELDHLPRTQKHIANPQKGSSAKRINMYLRWMVRQDTKGVDLGLWKGISPSKLYLPLDTHTGNIARQLGLLERKQNDWKAVAEVTSNLSKLDPKDPVKYDYALFGLGVYETV